jgi:hypothetical protein
LPRGRSEDVAFRQRLRAGPSVLKWTLLSMDPNPYAVSEPELLRSLSLS